MQLHWLEDEKESLKRGYGMPDGTGSSEHLSSHRIRDRENDTVGIYHNRFQNVETRRLMQHIAS